MKPLLKLWPQSGRFVSSRVRKAAQRTLNKIENEASPEEYCSIMANHPDATVQWLAHGSVTGQFLATVDMAQPFRREPISAGATLYRGGDSAKRLIVLFTGRQYRPMLPVPAFLQFIDASAWDVLMLRDEARMHYRAGVEGYAADMPALVRRVRHDLGNNSEVLAFGTSMGAFPAIRFFLAGGADRAVSISGRFPSDGVSLVSGCKPAKAFEPICACLEPRRRPLLFAHGGGNDDDRTAAELAAALVGGTTFNVLATDAHNLLAILWREERLADILDAILDGTTSHLTRSPECSGQVIST